MDANTVNIFIIGCIALLVALTGFLGKNWFTDQRKTSEKLANAIDRLTEFIDRVEKVQDHHGFRIDQIEKDLTLMAQQGFGRRAQDRADRPDPCDRGDCPFADKYPPVVPGPGDITLTGSAAKEVRRLFELAQEHKQQKGGD